MTTINTRLGRIKGNRGEGYCEFLGIPYAAPPVGDLRWQAPSPAAKWEGTYDATSYPNRAFQPPLPEVLGGSQGIPGEMSEDCLYLNIHTPAADDKKRPVLFWIHGGGFIQGSANDFNTAPFSRKHDVVVVAINYRLGMLGFLDLSALGEAYEGSASNGFRDQIAALQWVVDNISDYGGDPDNITICGASAGGGSVLALLGAPSATGLYQKAIAMSPGVIGASPPDVVTPFAASMDMDGPGFLEHLNTLSGQDIFDLQLASGMGALAAVDGVVVEKRSYDAIMAGETGVPYIGGCTRDEGTMLTPLIIDTGGVQAAAFFEMNLASTIGGGDGAGYTEFLTSVMPDGATMTDRMNRMWFDYFRGAALRAAQATSSAGIPAWIYNFEVPTDHELGIAHASDVPFAFYLFEDYDGPRPAFHDADDENNRRLAELWSMTIAQFVRSGDPNWDGIPTWPVYDTADRSCLMIRSDFSVAQNPDGEAALTAYGLTG